VFLIGRIEGVPILKDFADVKEVLCFTLETKETIRNNQELTEYHHIKVYKEVALAGKAELKTGQMIYLEGKIKTRNYYDEQQIKMYVLEIIVTRFGVLPITPALSQ